MENITAFIPAMLCMAALAMKGRIFAAAKKRMLPPKKSSSRIPPAQNAPKQD